MAADGGNEDLTYWATRSAEDLISALREKKTAYFNAAEQRGLKRMWEIAYCQYYGLNPAAIGDMATQTLAFVGANNEFIRFRLGEVRSFIKQQIGITRGERPAFKCLGANTDYATGAQIIESDNVVKYLYQTGSAENMEQLALEGDAVFGMCGAHIRWDYDGGEEVDVELPHPEGLMIPDPSGAIDEMTGEPVTVPATIPSRMRSGMPTTTIVYPWDAIGEANAVAGKHIWRLIIEPHSKHELAAQYPELAEQILAVQPRSSGSNHALIGTPETSAGQSDQVDVEHFYHKPSKAVPGGRYVGYVQDIPLWDEPCPLKDRIPFVELCSARYIGTPFGYSGNWDLISIQQMIDQLCSDHASNFTKFGRPMIVADEGLVLEQTLLARGHHIWTKPTEAEFPQAVTFAAMPPGSLEFLNYLHQRHQSISQQNGTTRGQSDKNITSGEMAALYHSLSIEFRSAEQGALNGFRKELVNVYLDMVRMFASAPFVAEISGHSERPYLKEFSQQDVSGIRRVIVEPVSAMSQSTPGRLAILQMLMKVEDPLMRGAALKGIETGQWNDFTKKERNADLRVQWENEQLAKGTSCAVMASDDPFVHVPQHLADIDARTEQLNGDPQAVQAYLEHVMEHLTQYQMLNPNLARILKIPLPLPVQGTPTGDANMMLTGPIDPVPQPGQIDAPSGGDPGGGAMPQGAVPGGTKIPNPAEPPPEAGAAAA